MEYSGSISAHSASWVQVILLPQPAVAGITSTHHHADLIIVFLAEMGFYHVGQADLKLQTSGDPPAMASQNAGITGVSHCAQSTFIILFLSLTFENLIIVCLGWSYLG